MFLKIKFFNWSLFLLIFILLIPSGLQSQTEWIKYQLNPVIGYDLLNGIPAVRPFVIEDRGLFRLYFTTDDINDEESISGALSFNGVRWYQLTGAPLLTAGVTGSFDEWGVTKACVVKDDEGYKMYYYSENKSPHSIGLAVSADGQHWCKHDGNPVLVAGRTGSWDDAGVWAPMVMYEGHGKYRMYYQGSDGEYANIGCAVSADGKIWEKFADNPVLCHGGYGEFDELASGEPSVVYAADRYHMFYTGTNTGVRNKIGYAYSHDGIGWTKYNGNPVLEAGPSDWEDQSVAAPAVVYRDSMFHMWYSGWSAGQAVNIGYAIAFFDSLISDTPDPGEFHLGQNFPNPFNHGTHISYNLPKAGNVVFKIYDLLGQEITTLENEVKSSGDHTLHWDADGIASGIYFYRIMTDQFLETKKMVLKK